MERINGYQYAVSRWKEGIVPSGDFTPKDEFDRMGEESQELSEAHQKYLETGDGHDAALEATDLLIRLFGYIHALGYDAENLLEDKLEVIYQKYNPIENKTLQSTNGITWQEAMRQQKELWGGYHE